MVDFVFHSVINKRTQKKAKKKNPSTRNKTNCEVHHREVAAAEEKNKKSQVCVVKQTKDEKINRSIKNHKIKKLYRETAAAAFIFE